MADILSQAEIDALLSALSSGEVSGDDSGADGGEQTVKLYDFKHPDRFSKDQVRTLQSMHEHFARLFSTSLSAFLRNIVEVKLVSIDQLSYDEFIRSIPNPTCICTINMKPLQAGYALLEMSPTLSFSIIDRLMGGAGYEFKRNRELTEIEQTIVEKVIGRAFDSLTEAWAKVAQLSPSLDKMETNPQLYLQLFLPTEMVILMTFEISCGETAGTMSLCIPYVVLEPVAQDLKPGSWLTGVQEAGTMQSPHMERLQRRLERVDMEIVVELGEAQLSVNDILDLRTGDVIPIETRQDGPVKVRIDEKVRFTGAPGTYHSRRAVKLIQRAETEVGML